MDTQAQLDEPEQPNAQAQNIAAEVEETESSLPGTQEPSESVEAPAETAEEVVSGEGAASSNHDVKFYMSPNGYVNTKAMRVRQHFTQPSLSASPFEKEF